MSDGLMPGVPFRQVVNRSPNGMRRPIMGPVEHHIVGTVESAESRFNQPSSQASAHFGVAYDGSIVQWVSVNDRAWHAARVGEGANYQWVGIENESPASGDDLFPPLTPEQVAANGRILAWLHETEGVPLQVTNNPDIGGVAYHHMVPSWGLTGCPGDAIIAQRQEIVNAANGGWLMALTDAEQADLYAKVNALYEDVQKTGPGIGSSAGASTRLTIEQIKAGIIALSDAVAKLPTDGAGAAGGPLVVTLTGTAKPG